MSNQTQTTKKIPAGGTLEKSSDQMADMPILAIQILDIMRNEKRCTMKSYYANPHAALHDQIVVSERFSRHGNAMAQAARGTRWYTLGIRDPNTKY